MGMSFTNCKMLCPVLTWGRTRLYLTIIKSPSIPLQFALMALNHVSKLLTASKISSECPSYSGCILHHSWMSFFTLLFLWSVTTHCLNPVTPVFIYWNSIYWAPTLGLLWGICWLSTAIPLSSLLGEPEFCSCISCQYGQRRQAPSIPMSSCLMPKWDMLILFPFSSDWLSIGTYSVVGSDL